MNITATLIGQIIAFVLLIWFVNKFLWGPLSAIMAEREKRIADGLAASEKGKHELELAEKKATENLHEAKAKAGEIIGQAEKRAAEIVDEAKDKAREEGERIVAAANAEIQHQANRVREELREQVATVAVSAAKKIVEREIDPKAHEKLIKDLATQI